MFKFSLLRITLLATVFAFLFSVAYFGYSNFFGVDISYESPEELGDVVVVKFGQLISEDSARESFSIKPDIEGDLVWHEEHKELHFIPVEGFEPGVEYRAAVGRALPLLATVGASGSNKAFTFSAVSFNSSPPVTGSYLETYRYIDVNLTTMELALVEDGQVVKTYPVAGKGNPWTKPTREGTFTIKTKEPNHFSRISYVWMPWSMQYSGNYFIHEWPYYPGGQKINAKYSSGCVRLFPGDAKEVYDWATVGTTVVVHSTEGRLPVFSPKAIQNGDMVREESDSGVYVVKKAGGKQFKRHVWTDRFGQWYAHLSPFWENIKIVADGSLAGYMESYWVQVDLPSDRPEGRYIYELDTDKKIKHLMLCGDTLSSTEVRPDLCKNSWTLYGWPAEELYTIREEEFNAYAEGEPKILKPSSSAYVIE